MPVSLKLFLTVPVVKDARVLHNSFHLSASLISLIIDEIDLSSIDPLPPALSEAKLKYICRWGEIIRESEGLLWQNLNLNELRFVRVTTECWKSLLWHYQLSCPKTLCHRGPFCKSHYPQISLDCDLCPRHAVYSVESAVTACLLV